jgi:hypothetical protein
MDLRIFYILGLEVAHDIYLLIKQNPTIRLFKLSIFICSLATSLVNQDRRIVISIHSFVLSR